MSSSRGSRSSPDFYWRSLLFAPADDPRKARKAMMAGADAVIIDLEDSVAPGAKSEARKLAREALDGERPCAVGVRVNGRDTDWYLDDLVAACATPPMPRSYLAAA